MRYPHFSQFGRSLSLIFASVVILTAASLASADEKVMAHPVAGSSKSNHVKRSSLTTAGIEVIKNVICRAKDAWKVFPINQSISKPMSNINSFDAQVTVNVVDGMANAGISICDAPKPKAKDFRDALNIFLRASQDCNSSGSGGGIGTVSPDCTTPNAIRPISASDWSRAWTAINNAKASTNK